MLYMCKGGGYPCVLDDQGLCEIGASPTHCGNCVNFLEYKLGCMFYGKFNVCTHEKNEDLCEECNCPRVKVYNG
jgi:hypothetical protein